MKLGKGSRLEWIFGAVVAVLALAGTALGTD